MSGGLIDLVAKGAQDVYLTGEPKVSFFRQNYKTHTNFSMKTERLDYTGTFNGGNQVVVPIVSKGDLLSYIWIEGTDIAGHGNQATFLHSNDDPTVTEFSLYIGGQEVIRLDSLYIQNVHNILYNPTSARASMAATLNYVPENARAATTKRMDHYLIPFYFCDDISKALPLVALQYHEVELRIRIRNNMTTTVAPRVYANFVYLDGPERDYFVNTNHEYLITQVQTLLASNLDTSFDLSYLNHPCKAVHLVSGKATEDNWINEYTFDKATLYINGNPLFENMSNVYHHTVVPMQYCSVLPGGDAIESAPLYTWPLCVTLNKAQPCGSTNFSRLDNASLKITSPTGGNNLHRIYAVNYNILRIQKGLGGVAFSS